MVTILFDGTAFGMLLFLMAVGLSVTMGLMNFVNLAHGSFAMAGGYAAAQAMQHLHASFGLALAAGFVAGALSGALLEAVLFRHFYRASPLSQVLLTIGVVFVSVALATFAFGATQQPFPLPEWLGGAMHLGMLDVSRYRLFLIVCGLVVLGVLLFVLDRTRYGAMVRAAVDNRRVAQGTGIDVQALFLGTFALGCGLAGLGGALSAGAIGLDPSFPIKYMIYFLIVVCIGGAGTITGPFVAAVLVGILDVASKYFLPESGAFMVYVFMIGALLLRPHGIVPRKGAV